MKSLRLNIPEIQLKTILTIVQTFGRAGYECYLVGGSVRDLLLGEECGDYDFATNARPDEVMKLFRKVIPTGIKHGTVTILMDGLSFEVTTYRADGKYIDGRRPETVSFSSSLEEDVCRRDFTINGLAYNVEKELILDYVDGMADIDRRIIRTIGNPDDRFSEDGLRTYRACRFAARLNFVIEEKTFEAITSKLDTAGLVSPERVRDELNKLLAAEKPSAGIEYMRKSGLLNLFLPELARCYGVSQNRFHVYDVYWHSLCSCDAAPADSLIIRLSALLHDIGKVLTRRDPGDGEATFYNHEVIGAKMARRILKRLRYSNDECEKINNLILNHMFHYTEEWSDGAVRRFMRKVGLENLQDLIALRMADRKGNGSREGLPSQISRLRERIAKAIEEENAISVRDLKINGTVIMEKFRLAPGPVIGKILNALLEDVLDDPAVNTPELLLEKAGELVKNFTETCRE